MEENLKIIISAASTGANVTLFLTNKRIIASKFSGMPMAIAGAATLGVLTGPIGLGIMVVASQIRANKKAEKTSKLSLDDMLAKDKKAVKVLYSDIDSIEIKKRGLWRTLKVLSKGKKYIWIVKGLPKEYSDQYGRKWADIIAEALPDNFQMEQANQTDDYTFWHPLPK